MALPAWETQSVGDNEAFLYVFKQTLSDCADQEWSSEINTLSRTSLLSQIKSCPVQEKYVYILKHKQLRASLAKLRCGNHSLMIEKGRHIKLPREDRKSELCKNGDIETEEHFVMHCEMLNELREKYIDHHIVDRNSYAFRKIISSSDSVILHDLGNFLCVAFKKRALLLEQAVQV